MKEFQAAASPFALMMDPQSVLQAMARSDRLSRLQRRICRPLDKPAPHGEGLDVEAFDRLIEAQADGEVA